MRQKILTLVNYIVWLYKKNITSQKSNENIFRVIKTRKNKNGENIIDVQVINKSSIFNSSAKEIASQDMLLECFSKNDIRLITYLATEDLLKPKTKIIGFECNTYPERTLLHIKKTGSDQLTKLTVDKLSANPELLKDLDQEDAHRAGYLTAIEQMILEKSSPKMQLKYFE